MRGSVLFSVRTESVGTPSYSFRPARVQARELFAFVPDPGRNSAHPNFTGIFDFQSATCKKY
ncbi:hypothetical protein LEP1GSC052_2567 [Leptospira kmetyi serovar Malaysia str. Bejo-Iso9]|nr:hypothetical protein LEP1GSC052_2567 [Leptospira kmetyi serovar Malaysia str. Bejo-Iso9]